MARLMAASILAFGTMLLLGCNSTPVPDDLPDRTPVRITVQQNGVGVAEAVVSMTTDPPTKWLASGHTDENGVAEMYTNAKYEGVVPGNYLVTVRKNDGSLPEKYAEAKTSELTLTVGADSVNETITIE